MRGLVAAITFLLILLLSFVCAFGQRGHYIYVQTAGSHATRVRYSTEPINYDEPPANPAFIDQKWNYGSTLPSWINILQTGGGVTIQAKPFIVTIKKEGRVLQQISLDTLTGKLSFLINNGPIMGLGEGSETMDKRGAFYNMKQGQTYPNPEKWIASIPVPFLIGTGGWAFFVANPTGQFDLTGEKGVFIPGKNTANAPLDIIFFDTAEPLDLFNDITGLVGKPVMPPKWALGYMQSQRTLQNTKQMIGLVDTFRQKKLPLDAVIYLGTGFTPRGWNKGHNSFDFNPKVFDIAPQQFINELHKRNTKMVVHVVPPTIGGRLQLLGWITGSTDGVVDSTTISRYWQKHQATFAMGMDGWWPDEGDAYTTKSLFLRSQMYYRGPLMDRPNERPWNLQRNGYLGIARYGGYIWSGDVLSDWKTLAAQIGVGLNYSLTVSPFWGTDTGGFIPTPELDGELYTRWFQFSAFCASFRSHGKTWHLRVPWGWNTGDYGIIEDPLKNLPPTTELHNDKVEAICREVLNLRYQLLPYNYTLTRQAHDDGLPMMRALWIHYPKDTVAIKQTGEYLWGKDLLVAPVTEKGATQKQVYLPNGTWYNWFTDKKEDGGQTISEQVQLETIPLYAKVGAIIPVDPIRQYTDEKVKEPTTIRVYRGADGKFTLYDDDGKSQDYLKGIGSWTEFVWNEKAQSLSIAPISIRHNSDPRKFNILFIPGNIKKQVKYNGRFKLIKL
ncbi:MAG: DUF5110 domain-containing protein [Mucilaginibacter sp.]|nr:DUF5110 domain-containing protein [Mucilaginibacter sp.]